jgi:hypothetical protein
VQNEESKQEVMVGAVFCGSVASGTTNDVLEFL